MNRSANESDHLIGHGLLPAFHDGCRCGWCESICWERGCVCGQCVALRAISPYVEIPHTLPKGTEK